MLKLRGAGLLLWLGMLAFAGGLGEPMRAAEAARPSSGIRQVKCLRAIVIRTYPGTDYIVVQDRTGYEFLCSLREVRLSCVNRRVLASGFRNGDSVLVRGPVEAF